MRESSSANSQSFPLVQLNYCYVFAFDHCQQRCLFIQIKRGRTLARTFIPIEETERSDLDHKSRDSINCVFRSDITGSIIYWWCHIRPQLGSH
jgi:hypothetical protein